MGFNWRQDGQTYIVGRVSIRGEVDITSLHIHGVVLQVHRTRKDHRKANAVEDLSIFVHSDKNVWLVYHVFLRLLFVLKETVGHPNLLSCG